jgi:hypothetical protein
MTGGEHLLIYTKIYLYASFSNMHLEKQVDKVLAIGGLL